MEGETSPFESSEMLASFLASTPLLSESWKLCSHANAATPESFVRNRIGDVSYVAFSGIQRDAGLDLGCRRSLVAVDTAAAGIFPALQRYGSEAEEPVMVHAGMLRLFLSMIKLRNFQTQVFDIMKESKLVVFTGHSLGGTMASLSALWLLSHPQSTTTVLSLTFGTPLLGNVALSRAILQERWGGNFCHVVGKHDIVPRLLLAPPSPLTPHLHSLLRYWHLSMTSPYFRLLTLELSDEEKNSLFLFVLSSVEALAKSGESLGRDSFCPFGNYVFCTNEGAICLDNVVAVVKMLHLMFATGCAASCIEDHLNYEAYVGKVSSEFLKSRGFAEGELPESSYEVGVTLALHSSEIDCRAPVWEPAKDCLKTAKRMGHAPNIKSANLAKVLSKFTPLRAQIEWYKASCDASDDRMGYYDTFKLGGPSKKDGKVDMNRRKLARFWDDLIQMLDTNQLPHDFHRRAKWVNASQFYKLLVEPLDIAEYYRTGMHREKGHYVTHGRERRYKLFDRWWSNTKVGEEENNQRNRYASLTQDSCFWARVEEARDWIENVRSESDSRKLTLIWENINNFEQYARSLVQRKEVSIDVLAENSSYSLWMKELRELKSQLQQFSP
ncbi:lipase-like PAD4 [Rhododendron vialii]|uniref:lipase-like PAD4 n=1 Tax=Rhododendron vialii TaxID=182163 RepID=UPI00265DFA19|nr:lipase-like PAD4 [Rhododendron vialii]